MALRKSIIGAVAMVACPFVGVVAYLACLGSTWNSGILLIGYFIAFLYSSSVVLPLTLIYIRRSRRGAIVFGGINFLVGFFVFAALFFFLARQFNEYTTGACVVVRSGVMTRCGLTAMLLNSALIAGIAGVLSSLSLRVIKGGAHAA